MQALTRGLAEVADVEPWTTVFNPGVSTLDRLVELTREVDFAAFVFAQDDWTQQPVRTRPPRARPRRATTWCSRPACSAVRWACAARSSSMRRAPSCRPTSWHDGGALPRGADGGRHAGGQPEAPQGDRGRGPAGPARGRLVAALAHRCAPSASRRRSASSGSRATGGRPRGHRPRRGRRTARSRRATGARRRRSAATRPASSTSGTGERPRHPNAPQLEGTGEIRLESADRASGYWTTRSETDPQLHERTSGVYLRADPEDMRRPRRRGPEGARRADRACGSRSGRRSRTRDAG